MKDHIAQLISTALTTLVEQGILPDSIEPKISIDRTKDKSHGDLASNIAMTLAKAAKKPPRDIAQLIIDNLPGSEKLAEAQIAGPGFINFFLNEAAAVAVVTEILQQKASFGTNNDGKNDKGEKKKVQVEFVSANPTGPLHVGHGRGAAVGDSICRLLKATNWDVTAEFYYNDAGQQINNLATSVQARCKGLGPEDESWPTDGYRGDYIVDVAKAYMDGKTIDAQDKHVIGAADSENFEAIAHFAVAYLRREQDLDLKAFGVDFDVFFLESSLYQQGKVEETVQQLITSGHSYEKDGALWLKTTDFGDDKDRVMRKSEGGYTYFVPDVAYHLNKWDRGFERVINEQGSDHHSTVTRVRAGLQAVSKDISLGIPDNWPEYVLHQMVLVMRGGTEVKISKRAGSYVTIRDLIDEVGQDATRYFLVARATTSQLTFDIDLAISQTNDNPVYYIQYAHARVCSVLRKLADKGWSWSPETGSNTLDQLTEDAEKMLLNKLAAYPETVKNAAINCEPHNVANYLKELAADFHSYYNSHKMLTDDEALRNARLSLSEAVRQVINNGLELLGVSAPEEM